MLKDSLLLVSPKICNKCIKWHLYIIQILQSQLKISRLSQKIAIMNYIPQKMLSVSSTSLYIPVIAPLVLKISPCGRSNLSSMGQATSESQDCPEHSPRDPAMKGVAEIQTHESGPCLYSLTLYLPLHFSVYQV